MKRKTGLLATVLFFLAVCPLVSSQELQSQPSPLLPSEILGPQLIAWSQLQKPQPVQQPLPQSAAQKAAEQTGQTATASDAQQWHSPAAQSLTGIIMKDGDRYVLNVSDSSTYQLDDQEKAKEYEGKQVKVAGTLDSSGSSLHVVSIELIS